MKKGIPSQIKPFNLPIIVIVLALVLTFFVVRPIFERIQKLRQETGLLAQKNKIMTNKISTLQTVSGLELEDKAKLTTSAVPVQNSALPALAVIRQAAAEAGVTVGNLQTSLGTKIEGNLNEVTLRTEVEGTISSLISFFDKLEQSLPLARVEKGNLISLGPSGQVSSEVKVFWQELAKTLPGVDERVQTLTPDEESLLSKISQFSKPQIILEELPPGQPRENPFSL